MSVVVFMPVTCNLAETTRMIEVAKALRAPHRAVFLGYEDTFSSLIVEAGFEYRSGTPAWTPDQQRQALNFDQGRSLRHPFSEKLIAARVACERELIAETGAKAVVIGTNLTSIISARAEGVPLFYPVPFALTRPHVEQTTHLGLIRGTNRLTRIADRAISRLFRQFYTRMPLVPAGFIRVARRHGVRPPRSPVDLLTADHNLLTVMPGELDGYHLPPCFRRVGPIYARLPGALPREIAALAHSTDPVIYLGLGSSANPRLARTACFALARLGLQVIAPLRHYLGDEPMPPGVHLTRLLPAHLLDGIVDAAVLHGGQGTVQTACAAGIPFVGMGLQPEQSWNIAVCVRRGHALQISPHQVGRAQLCRAVQHLLTEPRFGEVAARVQQEYAAEDGARRAAEAIEAELSPREQSH